MFGLGSWEIVVILLLALVVLGPRKLPELARHFGRFYSQIRRTTHELRSTLDQELMAEERTLRRDAARRRREELETVRRQREQEAADRLGEDAPSEPQRAADEQRAAEGTGAPEASEKEAETDAQAEDGNEP
ncbi:MAG: Sec-independent protein translocase protein TatB [Myxococcota bacterium]|nr:Sec-independent protein translocase protein TatB [Myxococcota bacterium]